jgi:hypothetical protein
MRVLRGELRRVLRGVLRGELRRALRGVLGIASRGHAILAAAAPENGHVDQRPDRRHRRQGGSLVWGTILALVGVYFLLKETFELDIPDIGRFWPVAVILVGIWFVWEGMTRSRS